MLRRTDTLQKKVQALESELAGVLFSHPTASDDPRLQMPFDAIKQQLSFLSKLLAAEVDAHPSQTTSHQLQEIDQRLNQLKAAFREWKKSTTASCAFNINHDDTLSICSDCTQALLYDDVNEAESGSPTTEPDDFSVEKSPEKFSDDKDDKGERIWKKIGIYCGVFGFGMIAGAICMLVKLFFYSDHLIEYEASLPPPT